MATKLNWRKLGFGSGAILAAISTAYAYSPSGNEEKKSDLGLRSRLPIAHMKSSKLTRDDIMTNVDKEVLQNAIQKSRALCERVKHEKGLPGLTVAVTVNGRVLWQEGFGLANLENNVPMRAESIMRIASISKSMTMAMLAKLMEEGKIDIDKPIQTYLPNYPEKYFNGEKVTITTRHLLSHLSGIRHYHKKGNNNDDEKDNNNKGKNKDAGNSDDKKDSKQKGKNSKNDAETSEFDLKEYYLKEKYSTVEEAMKLFQDDELFHKPGTKFLYTTHGWTVVSAIIEKLTDTEFTKYCRRMFDFWGLENTFIDLHEPIIYNRTSYYTRLKDGEIINAPYVDNSYKWAGGGFLSNVLDLTRFANVLLYSMQTPDLHSLKTCAKGLPKTPFLKQSTMKTVWTGNPVASYPQVPDMFYALGFVVEEPLRKCMFCKERDLMIVSHSGGAIGASSILVIVFPPENDSSCKPSMTNNDNLTQHLTEVNGVAVAMITNMTSAGLSKTAKNIAYNFRDLI